MQGRRPAIRSPNRPPHHGHSPSSSSASSTSSQLTATNPNASTSTIKLIPPSSPPATQQSPAGAQGYFEPTLIRSQSTQPQLQTQAPSAAAYAMQASQRKRSATAPSPTSPPLTSAISSAAANSGAPHDSPPTPPPHALPHPPPHHMQSLQPLNYTPPPAKREGSKMKIFSKPARIGTPTLDKALRPPPSPNKLSAISSPMPRLTPSAAAIAAAVSEGRKLSFSSMHSSGHSSAVSTLFSASSQDLNAQFSSIPGYSSSPPAQKEHSHSHKPHFLRPRRDKDHTFSSSASNSKAISADGSSLYSFGPSSPSSAVFGGSSKGDLQKSISGIDIGSGGKGGKGFKGGSSWEDGLLDAIGSGVISAEAAWPPLKARVLGLFEGEALRNTVEDLNKLVVMHIKRCYDRRSSILLLDDVRDLLDSGMLSLDPTLLAYADEKLIPRLVEIWSVLFGNILPYFEAVFLPLQQEFKGTGTLSPKESREFFGHHPDFDVRRLVLVSFRDNVILPLHGRLRILFSKLQLDFSVSQSEITHNAGRMLQCISVLSSVLTEDEAQEAIDELAKTLKHNWLTRGRTGRNRRGFVGTKTMRVV